MNLNVDSKLRNSKLRNGLVASLALLIGSLAFALSTHSRFAHVAGGSASTAAQAEVFATTDFASAQQANGLTEEQQLKRELRALGIWVN